MRRSARSVIFVGLTCAMLTANVGLAHAAPSNDNFADATIISALPFNDTVDSSSATKEDGEPTYCAGTRRSVWYRYTPTDDASLIVDLRATFGVGITVFDGTSPFSIQQVGCTSGVPRALLSFRALTAHTYYIRIGGTYGQGGMLDLTVSVVGAISGTVTDEAEHAPQSDICVDAFDPASHARIAGAITDNDGGYTIANLPPGDLKLRFTDCITGRSSDEFSTQWYANRKSFASADPVVVITGADRTGIDVEMRLRPRPDLTIDDVTITNVPLQVGPDTGQEFPATGTSRTVTVTAGNIGAVSPRWAKISVDICPRTAGSCKRVGEKSASLAPGATAKRSFAWNAADMVGDVTVQVMVNTNDDGDWNNNISETSTFVHVGGTGFGYAPTCLRPTGTQIPQSLIPCIKL